MVDIEREHDFPMDADGYRACSVCMESVTDPEGQVWVQVNDVCVSTGNDKMRRHWPMVEGAEYDDWEMDEDFAPLSGPVLHMTCVQMYLETLVAETAVLCRAKFGDG